MVPRLERRRAQHGTDLAGARPLTHGEIAGHLPADDPFRDQLEHHRRDRADGDDEVAIDDGDSKPGGGADHEVAQLHRQPQDRIEQSGSPLIAWKTRDSTRLIDGLRASMIDTAR